MERVHAYRSMPLPAKVVAGAALMFALRTKVAIA
jgi:hypothetical protein